MHAKSVNQDFKKKSKLVFQMYQYENCGCGKQHQKLKVGRTFLVVQWLKLCYHYRRPGFNSWSGN